LTKPYLVSDDPSLSADAYKLLNEADEVMTRGQKRIRRLLQRLGVMPEGSEASSLENVDVWASKPPPAGRAPEEFFSFRWGSRGDHGDEEDKVRRGPGPGPGRGQERTWLGERVAWQCCCEAWVEPRPMTVGGLPSRGSMWNTPNSRNGGHIGGQTTAT
jgi:hypothetical protein